MQQTQKQQKKRKNRSQNRPKRIATLFFSVLCLLIAAAPVYGTVTGADFSDVTEEYWGYSYIDDTARVGIIEGYPEADGARTFRPENRVTKQEAITMVVNTATRAGIGFTNADYVEKQQTVMEGAGIDTWAYPYVAFALEKGFLEEKELAGFMSAPGVSREATREEVFNWMGKALWKKYKGLEESLFVLTYTDAEQIGEECLSSVGLLSNLGILSGNDNGNGTYSLLPKSPIKRVEFAVICSKVYGLAKSKSATSKGTLITGVDGPAYGSVSGLLTDVRPKQDKAYGSFRITNENGIPYTFFVGTAACYVDGSAKDVSLSALENSHAVVSHDDTGILHIDTHMTYLTGIITNLRKEDDLGYQRLGIRLTGDTGTVFYFVNSKQSGVSVSGRLAMNKKVTFLADGVNIVEIVSK